MGGTPDLQPSHHGRDLEIERALTINRNDYKNPSTDAAINNKRSETMIETPEPESAKTAKNSCVTSGVIHPTKLREDELIETEKYKLQEEKPHENEY